MSNTQDNNITIFVSIIVGIIFGGILVTFIASKAYERQQEYWRTLITDNPETIAAIRSSVSAQREEARLLDE